MPLNINTSERRDGAAGTPGAAGANGTVASRSGTAGADGSAGLGMLIRLRDLPFVGDAGGDQVNLSSQATGGAGSTGGLGGAGAAAQVVVNTSVTVGTNTTQTIGYDDAGAGGDGGNGGAGGMGQVRYDQITADLGGGRFSQNAFTLAGTAWGGNGSAGGSSGAGGGSNYTADWLTQTTSPPWSSRYIQDGSAGGQAGHGGDGGDGGDARVVLRDIAVAGENVALRFTGSALGGAGGSGGSGASGGSGDVGAPGGAGGAGGDGGDALARLVDVDVAVTGGLTLLVSLEARGGAGGGGAQGGSPGSGLISILRDVNGVRNQAESSSTTTYAAAGIGGAGGAGGDGIVRVDGLDVTGGDVRDTVEFLLRASGGAGGLGGQGGQGVAGSVSGISTVVGVPEGEDGAAGATGAARITIADSVIALGGGDDRVTFDLLASGPGAKTVTLLRNHVDGGTGFDTLVLGTGKAGEPAALVDLRDGIFKLGGGTGNTLAGFESFTGTSGADRFRDGLGDQVYRGGAGADTFIFSALLPGRDRIEDLSAGDVVLFASFRGAFASFAQILDATVDTPQGALITLQPGSTLLLAGRTEAGLTADLFGL